VLDALREAMQDRQMGGTGRAGTHMMDIRASASTIIRRRARNTALRRRLRPITKAGKKACDSIARHSGGSTSARAAGVIGASARPSWRRLFSAAFETGQGLYRESKHSDQLRRDIQAYEDKLKLSKRCRRARETAQENSRSGRRGARGAAANASLAG
jgi:hypothetical protein